MDKLKKQQNEGKMELLNLLFLLMLEGSNYIQEKRSYSCNLNKKLEHIRALVVAQSLNYSCTKYEETNKEVED